MSEHQMSPKEVKKLLGISRSAMRYYTDKKIISSKRNPDNDYSYYSGGDLLELIDVAFYRNCLDATADDIRKMTFADSVESMRYNYNQQIEAFEERIKREQIKLDMLENFRGQIDRAIKNLNHIKIAHLHNPFYLFYFDENEQADIHAEYFQVSYWLGEFVFNKDKPVYETTCNMISIEYVKYLDYLYPGIKYKKINGGDFLYSSFTSDKELNDSSLLEPMLLYARENNIQLEEPIFIVYLCTFRDNDIRSHLYEAYIKVK